MLGYLRRLEEHIRAVELSLLSKAKTDTLDDLRYKAGQIDGLRAALQLAQQEYSKEIPNG